MGEEVDTKTENRGFPDDLEGRMAMAERLAVEVRTLRQQLNEATGPKRKTQRQRILLMIDAREWRMGYLNPQKYGKKPKLL